MAGAIDKRTGACPPKRESKITPEYHKEIITLKGEGKSYQQIIDLFEGRLHLVLSQISVEVHNHHRQVCSCYV